MYCPSPGAIAPAGNCSDGYFCAGNATTAQPTDGTTGDECPLGHYCPAGSGQPLPCEDGTYAGVTTMSVCDECTPGYYCVPGESDVTPAACPAGYYCPAGTGYIWTPCPLGTFSTATGLSNITQCTPCTGKLTTYFMYIQFSISLLKVEIIYLKFLVLLNREFGY